MGVLELVAICIATIAGPVLAVQVQRSIDRRREQRARRQRIFYTLMTTRGSNLNPDHVNALNAVPLDFDGKSESLAGIREAWREYMHHLNKDPSADTAWGSRRVELLVALLKRMGKELDYAFDSVQIEQEIYMPRGAAEIETDLSIIRRGLTKVFLDQAAFPLHVKAMPANPEATALMQRVLEKLEAWLDKNTPKT